MKRICLILTLAPLIMSCQRNSDSELFQSSRDNVIDVHDKIKEIDLGDVYVNRWSQPLIADNYLVIADGKAAETPLYVFDANSFNYVASIGAMGPGPFEVLNMGHVNWIPNTREVFVSDLAKMSVLSFNLDSAVTNPDYKPWVKYHLDEQNTPFCNNFANDTTSISSLLLIEGEDVQGRTAKVNFRSGETIFLPYYNDKVSDHRAHLAVSFEDSLCAECHMFYDYVCIFDMEGRLKRNVYGPQWNDDAPLCFTGAVFTRDFLIASYDGHDCERNEMATKCEVFTKTGDYVATLNVGYRIMKMCYDAKQDRIIFTFDDDIELGYLSIGDLPL